MTRPGREAGEEASLRRAAGQGRVRAAQQRGNDVGAAGRIADPRDHISEERAG